MCLAAPVRIFDLPGDGTATVDKNGVQFTVSALLFPELQINDYVLVHAGFIIQKIEEDDAVERIEMIENLYSENP